MYDDLGVDWASSTLGFLAIAFIPIPFMLYFVSLLIQGQLCSFADTYLVWRDTTQEVQ